MDDDEQITCIATVVDEGGNQTSDLIVRTLGNTPPTIESASLTPDPLFSQDNVQCIPQGVEDIDGDEVFTDFEWFVNDLLQPNTDDILEGPFNVGDEVICSITTTDGKARESTFVSITVSNTPPIISSTSISPDADVTTNMVLTCAVSALDTDGQTLLTTYRWNKQDGTFLGSDETLRSHLKRSTQKMSSHAL